MEAAPSSETLVAVPIYTALLVTSSTSPWELQTGSSSIDLLSYSTSLQNTACARCNVVKCKTFWKIPVFRDLTPCGSVVTDVSEELTCSIFRAQSKKHDTFVQKAMILGAGTLMAKMGTVVHIYAWGIFHCRLSLRSSGSVHKCSQICNITTNWQK